MTLFDPKLVDLARMLLDDLKSCGKRIGTAESCTGGLISGLLTEVPGSSAAVGRCFVTYSNEAKHDVLGVRGETLAAHGAVSGETVSEMAEGLLAKAGPDADVAVAVSGVAGPDGGTDAKPVGTVYMAAAIRGGPTLVRHAIFPGDRTEIRLRAVERALTLAREALGRA
jgi:nicotinamide-nucleotide amidase